MIWLFGYGSLIWRPSFDFVERRAAYVEGWTRRFAQGSPDHRGVPGAPGRVATLLRARGESCGGCAYRLADERADEILAALDHREQAGFDRLSVPVATRPGDPPFADALVYVANETNAHFLGDETDANVADHVRRAHGPSGSNVEYVLRLRDALAELGIDDPYVERIAKLLS